MSTSFINGPAGTQVLMLRRSPRFLRVIRSAGGKWDALDHTDDLPYAGDTLYAYRRVGEPIVGCIDYRGGDGRRTGGRFSFARYAHVDPQPPDEVLRDTAAWQAWCRAAAAAAAGTDPGPAVASSGAEFFGLPDVQLPRGRARHVSPPADGQGHLFGGRP